MGPNPNTHERTDLNTIRIVSTNYAALMDNRKKHSSANVILHILYRLTAFSCYLLYLVGLTVPFSKVTQCMNGLLPILRAMDTQAITYPYSFLQLLGMGTDSTGSTFAFLEYLYDKLFRHLEWNPFIIKNSSGDEGGGFVFNR